MASDHERYYRWRRRETLGQLTFWGELWVDPKTLPEYEYWLALGKQRGHGFEQDSAKYYITRTLLDEVLFAAGGVEAELLRLRRTTATAQEWTDQALREHPRSEGALATFSGAPTLLEGYYAFTTGLWWARAVDERTDRPYKPGRHTPRSGLLPALAPGDLHDRVAAALQQLRRDLHETRLMANFALHAGPLLGGGTPSALVRDDGRIVLRLPNKLRTRITTWEEFSYTEGRDMLTFAEGIMSQVEVFVEELLSALEAARPLRGGLLPCFD